MRIRGTFSYARHALGASILSLLESSVWISLDLMRSDSGFHHVALNPNPCPLDFISSREIRRSLFAAQIRLDLTGPREIRARRGGFPAAGLLDFIAVHDIRPVAYGCGAVANYALAPLFFAGEPFFNVRGCHCTESLADSVLGRGRYLNAPGSPALFHACEGLARSMERPTCFAAAGAAEKSLPYALRGAPMIYMSIVF